MGALKDEFEKRGYVVIKRLVDSAGAATLRTEIMREFRKTASSPAGSASKQLMTGTLLAELPAVAALQFDRCILEACREIFGEFHCVGDITIPRNNELKTGIPGWHTDADSNFALRYFNPDLTREGYRLAKVGIYLQDLSCPTAPPSP